MANSARAVIEAALRARKLDCTLTTALPPLAGAEAVATGIASLDALLAGGLPRGQISEVIGPSSSGRTALLLRLLAAATRREEIVTLVDTFDRLDVAAAASAGVDLDRLLWIRGHAVSRPQASGAGLQAGLERLVERALKALNLVLQAGGFGVVAIDLADAPPGALRRLPFTTWLRLQRTIEGSDTACVLVAPQPLARSAGGLTLTLAARPRWKAQGSGRTAQGMALLTGLDITARVVSPRQPVDGAITVGAQVQECAGAQTPVYECAGSAR